jgi:hypothetical protein
MHQYSRIPRPVKRQDTSQGKKQAHRETRANTARNGEPYTVHVNSRSRRVVAEKFLRPHPARGRQLRQRGRIHLDESSARRTLHRSPRLPALRLFHDRLEKTSRKLRLILVPPMEIKALHRAESPATVEPAAACICRAHRCARITRAPLGGPPLTLIFGFPPSIFVVSPLTCRVRCRIVRPGFLRPVYAPPTAAGAELHACPSRGAALDFRPAASDLPYLPSNRCVAVWPV